MKRLLIMASLFWPQKNSGGPPISLFNLVTALKNHFDIYVIANHHELGDPARLPGIGEGWNEYPFGKAYYIPYGEHTTARVAALIEEVAPDVIYQNSFFSANDLLPVLTYKKKHKAVKVVVAPRGEFYPERFRVGFLKKKVYCTVLRLSGLLKDVYFQGTGPDECAQEKKLLGIKDDHLYNVQNLSVMTGITSAPLAKEPGELRLVFVARIHPTKNVRRAIEMLRAVPGQVCYDLYGSIEDEDYWEGCLDVIQSLPPSVTVTYKGRIDHEDVPATLLGYHAYYMPTTGENFGHSIVESMLLGRPVIISDQTPWTDVNGRGGVACALEDTEGFAQGLSRLSACDQATFDSLCQEVKSYIKDKLNTDHIVTQYMDMFDGDIHD